MNALATQSPLMVPVQWNGQEYYTSQYFHRQYLTNSDPARAKYQRHHNFLQLLRSIEAYHLYVEHSDILELAWQRIKAEGNVQGISWQPLFQAAGWNPLTLLNATAQLAMTHHLDDALSQQMSVAVNTAVARQATAALAATPAEAALAIAQAVVAIERRQLALEARQEAQDARLQALTERQPPMGRFHPTQWLHRYGKPRLPREVLDNFRAACRRAEEATWYRPDGYDYQLPYYTPETLARAYVEATKQLSFLLPTREEQHRQRRR